MRVMPLRAADPQPAVDIRPLLTALFNTAIEASQPALRIPAFLPSPPKGRTVVIGAGKASAAMARVLEQHWQGPLEGVVVTRYGYGVACEKIRILEAAHPVPDLQGHAAAQQILQAVSGLTEEDLVICLISGGGSALMPLPMQGLAFADKQAINTALLAAGASISEMNCVRRHLSAIKGGRLAAACHPARVVNLVISDVPADDLSDIASGPTVPDLTTCADALAIVRRYGVSLPSEVQQALEAGRNESLKPGDARLPQIQTHLVAAPQAALEAAASQARKAGIATYILGDSIEGEARDVAKVMAGIALQVRRRGQPFVAPCLLLSGGETTVTVRGQGRGGRNVEFLLALAIALGGAAGVHALAGDTDGVDGAEELAGAYIGPDTLARARALGLSPQQCLDGNDGHGFFQALGDSVITGPTLTNVNDFRAIYIAAPAPSFQQQEHA
ncbi:glycerate 2-kinase [Pseudoxanthomonas sp. GM95]|uniref:glycerate kinase type-2 family protein n=1 Tax=Pseudoxanthomonas sp. GM95 TaxID=1881043 RepID=UPI0008BF3210|nr:glycerate kinase [Pseudoxanthomonas sp. GM95]SEL08069.1 glycerate 2-kinase [Pseudoxanthomonas sp. GM95]